jgi:uncharacterized membrane protein
MTAGETGAALVVVEIYRILSFVALGVILLCVSWIYSRFRENLRRLL